MTAKLQPARSGCSPDSDGRDWIVYAVSRRMRREPGFGSRSNSSVSMPSKSSARAAAAVLRVDHRQGHARLHRAVVLVALYAGYLVVLNRIPPRVQEDISDLGHIPRAVLKLPPVQRNLAILGLFVLGGAALYFTAHPFLESMKGLAVTFGISTFVFVQWVAPFLSEFPRRPVRSTGRSRGKAGMALMNMASSNINRGPCSRR